MFSAITAGGTPHPESQKLQPVPQGTSNEPGSGKDPFQEAALTRSDENPVGGSNRIIPVGAYLRGIASYDSAIALRGFAKGVVGPGSFLNWTEAVCTANPVSLAATLLRELVQCRSFGDLRRLPAACLPGVWQGRKYYQEWLQGSASVAPALKELEEKLIGAERSADPAAAREILTSIGSTQDGLYVRFEEKRELPQHELSMLSAISLRAACLLPPEERFSALARNPILPSLESFPRVYVVPTSEIMRVLLMMTCPQVAGGTFVDLVRSFDGRCFAENPWRDVLDASQKIAELGNHLVGLPGASILAERLDSFSRGIEPSARAKFLAVATMLLRPGSAQHDRFIQEYRDTCIAAGTGEVQLHRPLAGEYDYMSGPEQVRDRRQFAEGMLGLLSTIERLDRVDNTARPDPSSDHTARRGANGKKDEHLAVALIRSSLQGVAGLLETQPSRLDS